MNGIAEITPAELKSRLERGESLQLIDVREEEEVAFGIIAGAKHVPMGEIPHRLAEIPREGETVLICRSGNRSGKVYEYLNTLGYRNLKNMRGGMLEWSKL